MHREAGFTESSWTQKQKFIDINTQETNYKLNKLKLDTQDKTRRSLCKMKRGLKENRTLQKWSTRDKYRGRKIREKRPNIQHNY